MHIHTYTHTYINRDRYRHVYVRVPVCFARVLCVCRVPVVYDAVVALLQLDPVFGQCYASAACC